MLLSIRTKGGLKDNLFYNNVQESNNFVFKSKIKEKKATESVGYRPVLNCTWREAILISSIRDWQCLEKVHMFFPLLISICL